ncbi:MAG: DUF4272 domain-containing protein [Planctomycetales bacterium]|nr:DUF4272 domain-containing protein [Planctomycetales bacterium]
MAFEPINLFSHRIDPPGVTRLLREIVPRLSVIGPDTNWSRAEATLPVDGQLEPGTQLVLVHDEQYYGGPGWPRQVLGMQGYFARFPDTPNKPDIMRMIRSFRFALAVPTHDLDIDSDDPRLEVLYAICRHLDGVIFTPTSLRDANGRILFGSHGDVDPAAQLPATTPADGDEAWDEDADWAPDDELLEREDDEGDDAEEYDHLELEVDADDEDEDEDEERVPPTPRRVAQRLLALTAVAARATLEIDVLDGDVDDGDAHRHDIIDWVETLEIGDELEPDEWQVLQRPVRRLEQQDLINAMWRVEGLAVLAWAMQLHPLPPYDEMVAPAELFRSLGLLDADAAREHLQSPQLRSTDELEAMHEHLLFVHWRMRDFSLRAKPMDFVEFSENCWFGSFDISKFKIIDRDIALGDVAISEASREQLARATSTAMERHLAINWLLGDSKIYSKTDTST